MLTHELAEPYRALMLAHDFISPEHEVSHVEVRAGCRRAMFYLFKWSEL
jgi:hypothetical protein